MFENWDKGSQWGIHLHNNRKKDNVKTISLKTSWNTASTKTRWSQGHSMVDEKEDEETMALSVS